VKKYNSKLIFLQTIINRIYYNEWYQIISITDYKKNNIILSNVFGPFKARLPKLFKLFYVVIFLTLPLIILLVFTYDFIKTCIKYFFHSKQKYKFERLFIFAPKQIVKIGQRAGLFTDKDHLLVYPNENCKEVDVDKQIKIYDIINFKMILSSYLNSLQVFFISINRFGYMNSIYTLKAYSWFLLSEALLNLDIKTEIFSGCQKDRWALLFDKLPHKKKNIIQHGTNIVRKPKDNNISKRFLIYSEENNIYAMSMPIKLSNINKLYAYSEIEAQAMILGEHKAFPEIIIIGSGLKLQKLNKNKPTVLIIGDYSINAPIENYLVNFLQKYDINLYIKPHPITKKNSYKRLCEKYNFILLTDNSFLDFDLVFSYSSTLAFDYERHNIKVVYYSDIINDGKIETMGEAIDDFLPNFLKQKQAITL
jgi:hypothetical protein